MNKSLALRTCRVRCFKAIRDSELVTFTPLTVFVGNNGSGKSSLLEALETIQSIVMNGLDPAMQRWRGFEHIWNHAADHKEKKTQGRPYHFNPMRFYLNGAMGKQALTLMMRINSAPGHDKQFIQDEDIDIAKIAHIKRNDTGVVFFEDRVNRDTQERKIPDGESAVRGFAPELAEFIASWQFLSLIPQSMGRPVLQKRTAGNVRLDQDGANIADYLRDMRELDTPAFEGLLDAVRYVLPFAMELQPQPTDVDRSVYLPMKEGTFTVPGWLLSTGTLRILALLALLRHPKPPPLILVDEIENGLDPRTLGLLVEEIRTAVQSGRTQVIATTHSPYFLDLLALSHIVTVNRIESQPCFSRPADQTTLQGWREKFSPGRLYTMGLLDRKE